MGGVDIYKNQIVDMIEGGIGGIVSFCICKLFDFDGWVIVFGGDYLYGDVVEKGSFIFFGLYSD